jgi:hypothetical protein
MSERKQEQTVREDLIDLSDWAKGCQTRPPSLTPTRRRGTSSAPRTVDRMEAWLEHALSRDPVG